MAFQAGVLRLEAGRCSRDQEGVASTRLPSKSDRIGRGIMVKRIVKRRGGGRRVNG